MPWHSRPTSGCSCNTLVLHIYRESAQNVLSFFLKTLFGSIYPTGLPLPFLGVGMDDWRVHTHARLCDPVFLARGAHQKEGMHAHLWCSVSFRPF